MPLFALVATALAASPAEPQAEPPWDRVSLTLAVLAANPEIAEAEAALHAARAHTDVVGAWGDPMVDLSLAPLSITSGMIGWDARVSQDLPLWGVRRAAKDRAGADADAAEARLTMMRLDLARMSAMAWADWYVTHSEITLMQHTIELLAHIEDAASARLATGKSAELDVLQTRAEAAGLAASLPLLQAERDAVAAQINTLLHRPLETPVPPPPAPTVPPEPGAPSTPRRPELAEADAMVRAAQAGERMARLDRLPMLGWMLEWDGMQQMPEMRLMGGVSIQIPLALRSRAGAVREGEASVAAAEAGRTKMADAVSLDVRTAQLRYSGQAEAVRVIDAELIPATDARVEAARAAFSAGMQDLRPLLDAERAAMDAGIRHAQALAALQLRAADLEIALGSTPGDSR